MSLHTLDLIGGLAVIVLVAAVAVWALRGSEHDREPYTDDLPGLDRHHQVTRALDDARRRAAEPEWYRADQGVKW